MMLKLDLTKLYKSYYTAQAKPEVIQIDHAQYISITGQGDPSGKEFADRIKALYAVAYNLKFRCKSQNQDFTVAKLEGLWWFNEKKYSGITMEQAPLKIPRKEWEYRLLIRQSDYITADQIREACEQVLIKKPLELVKEVECYEMREGKVVQMLHMGPFSQEPVTLLKMFNFMQEQGLQRAGLHHEIYLSDFRKTASEKLRTILREPVK